MKNNLTTFCTVAMFLLLALPAVASAESDDLWGLYALAKSRDPSIGRAWSRLTANKADEDTAFSRFLPRVEGSAGITWITNTTYNYNGQDEVKGSYQGHNYGVSARLPLVQLPTYYTFNATKAATRSADAELEGIRKELMVRVCEAYFGILKAQTDVLQYRGEMKRLVKVYDQAQAFLKAGTADISTVSEAKARLDSAASDMVKAESRKKFAIQKMSVITGRDVAGVKELGEFTPVGPEPADIQWWVDTMQKNSPNLIKVREELNQMSEQLKAAKAGHYPVLQTSGGYSVSKGSTFLPEVETAQWYIGFNVSLPIYSGGETESRTRRSVAEESEKRYMLEEVREQAVVKLKETFLSLESNIAIITSLRQKKASAEVHLSAMTKGRSMGTRTAIEFFNAEQSYTVSQRDLLSALYDNALYRMQLKAAAGILEERDLRDLNLALVEKGASDQ